MKPVLLYGAGGHGLVVLDTLSQLGIEVVGVFDDFSKASLFVTSPLLGAYNESLHSTVPMVITIGDNEGRKNAALRVHHSFATVIARSALISASAKIGAGSMVLQNVIVQASAQIGNHVILNTACQVDHNCLVGDFAHIAPGVTLCGDVSIGEGTLVGAAAVLIPKVKVGKWCIVGAGAVVINDVPDGVVVAGNPARVIRGRK